MAENQDQNSEAEFGLWRRPASRQVLSGELQPDPASRRIRLRLRVSSSSEYGIHGTADDDQIIEQAGGNRLRGDQ